MMYRKRRTYFMGCTATQGSGGRGGGGAGRNVCDERKIVVLSILPSNSLLRYYAAPLCTIYSS